MLQDVYLGTISRLSCFVVGEPFLSWPMVLCWVFLDLVPTSNNPDFEVSYSRVETKGGKEGRNKGR